MDKAPIIGISRLSMGWDGHGITTLVAFHDCGLRCKYCINPQCFSETARVMWVTAEEIMDILHKDELYFLATNGGICFGGGEPLLKADFIKRVYDAGAKQWRITIETSLNAPLEYLQSVEPYVNEFIVDIKDMNGGIYESYTGKDNIMVIANLKWLAKKGRACDIVCRIPLIPDFNTEKDRDASVYAIEALGITRFDKFEYIRNLKDEVWMVN